MASDARLAPGAVRSVMDLHPSLVPNLIAGAESAAAFDDLTRSGRDELLARQTAGSWPNLFRVARFIPAVEYIQANRARTLLVSALHRAWEGVDVVVSPSFAANLVLSTNLTGYPVVVAPNGFRDARATPYG
jgi:hypothetical protein